MLQKAPLFLDEWLREDVIKDASTRENADRMRALPTRRLIYYCMARRLAATLEHVMQNSLHYSRKFVERPGRNLIDQAIGNFRKTAALCLSSNSRTYSLIEEQIRGILTSLPFTSQEELVREPEAFLAVSHSDVEGLISQESSGTTGSLPGEYKRVFCTREDLEKTIGFFMQGMRYLVDQAEGDSVALLLAAGGQGESNLAGVFGEAMQRLGVPCFTPKNTDDEPALLAELAAFTPTCIIGAPRQIASIFRNSENAEQIGRIKGRLKNILISGDRISSALSGILSAELEADIFTHYGMVETGLGTAVECGCRRGCHYRETDFLIEIIAQDGVSHPLPQNMRETLYVDPDDIDGGQVYSPTPWGEITVTSLTRQASPLIRYRTGDFGRIVLNRCACGSELWRLEVRGRMGDYVELPQRPEDVTPIYLNHGIFDRALYPLPWVRDHQIVAHVDENDKTCDIALTVLLDGKAPDEDTARLEVKKILSPVTTRALSHGVPISLRLLRSREEFARSFLYTHKRAFLRSSEPLDTVLYSPAHDN